MGKCLVTKLSGVVDNNELLKIEEFQIDITGNSEIWVGLPSNVSVDARIVGKGYFTDEKYAANNGDKKQIANQVDSNSYDYGYSKVYVTGTNCKLLIGGKYKLTQLRTNGECGINIMEQLSFCKNISEYLTESAHEYNIVDIFNTFPLLKIASLKFNGDISKLKSSSIQQIWSNSKRDDLYGDISKAPETLYYVKNGSFDWNSTRSASAFIIGLTHCIVKNIDAMLINQANCTAKEDVVSYLKLINVSGENRTNASNDAIATLQSKGYTVSVPAATE
nr:MAG TPA: hypothetical protein [Bacteriophage sp.]